MTFLGNVLSISYIRVSTIHTKNKRGGTNCLLINEFSYKRVSYIRVSIIHNKEGVWPGGKNSLAITEFSYKRVAYNRRVLYLKWHHESVSTVDELGAPLYTLPGCKSLI